MNLLRSFSRVRHRRVHTRPKFTARVSSIARGVFLSSAVFIQGCAFELAALPDSSFGTHSTTHASESAWPASRSKSVTDALPGTVLSVQSSKATATPRSSLESSTDRLLDSYSSLSNDDVGTDRADVVQPRRGGMDETDQIDSRKQLDSYSIEAVSTSVHALLFTLASDAGLQLAIKGKLDARVTVNSVRQPLEKILTSLAEQAGFAWQLRAGTLTVWGGKAFSFSYPINYLNIHRSTQSSVGLATQVGTINATDDSGTSIANSSQTRVENTSEHHFWDSLAVDVENLLSHHPADGSDAGTRFSVNREAGLLTLYARPDVHRDLQSYISLLHSSTQRQVLIEATVVEVALSENFDAGVDWQVLANGISGVSAAQILVGAPLAAAETVNRIAAPAGLVSLVQQGSNRDVQATLSLLEQFGDVRILSRPRIIALNNQSSVLKVVDNRVYFTVNVQRRQTEERDEIVTETEIHTVPVGLVMNVTPQISEEGMVMLNVRPTLSRILGFVDDPNPELALANVRNGVPEIQVREMESMLQVRSGDVAIIGGLMQETQADTDARLPGLGALPVIGRLFARQSRERRQTELLIVLRPTVLDDENPLNRPRS